MLVVNKEALEKIRHLDKMYRERWGCNVDYSIIPAGLSQEKMVNVLERIVVTGESILVGYSRLMTGEVDDKGANGNGQEDNRHAKSGCRE